MSPKRSMNSRSVHRIAVTVGCAKRFKKSHQCTPNCFRRTAEAVLALASVVQGPCSRMPVSDCGDPPISAELDNDAECLSDAIVNALSPRDLGGDDADLITIELGRCSAEVSRRRHVDGIVYGGTVELSLVGSLWDAFSAAGRIVWPVREARYFRVGQFQVESRKLILYGELLADAVD